MTTQLPVPPPSHAPHPAIFVPPNINVGDKALITTFGWFTAPNGRSYRAAFGTVKAVRSDVEVLGIKTNARSTNWYIDIGNLTVAGCQVLYAVRCDSAYMGEVERWEVHEGVVVRSMQPSMVFDADAATP